MQPVVWFVGACVVSGLGWFLLQVSRWSAPLSGVAGLALGVIGVYTGSLSLMGWGFGLFLWSALLFVLGGGMNR